MAVNQKKTPSSVNFFYQISLLHGMVFMFAKCAIAIYRISFAISLPQLMATIHKKVFITLHDILYGAKI